MKLVFVITNFILLTGNNFAQSEDISVPSAADTVFRYLGINPANKFYYDEYDFYIPFNFSIAESEQLPDGNIANLQLRTELALSYPTVFNTSSPDDMNHFMLPYYNRYLENSKLDPVRYVLGLAQAAAVGYMAYRHIKKYGFWK